MKGLKDVYSCFTCGSGFNYLLVHDWENERPVERRHRMIDRYVAKWHMIILATRAKNIHAKNTSNTHNT